MLKFLSAALLALGTSASAATFVQLTMGIDDLTSDFPFVVTPFTYRDGPLSEESGPARLSFSFEVLYRDRLRDPRQRAVASIGGIFDVTVLSPRPNFRFRLDGIVSGSGGATVTVVNNRFQCEPICTFGPEGREFTFSSGGLGVSQVPLPLGGPLLGAALLILAGSKRSQRQKQRLGA